VTRTVWSIRGCSLALAALALAACGGKRTETEHQLFRWAEALNHHLATSFAEGNEYPHRLAEVDPLLRVALPFDDPWGRPIHYRRIDDGHYDIASAGPDGTLGNEDDVIVNNAILYKPADIYSKRPASGMKPQRESDAASGEGEGGAEADAGGLEGADEGDDGY
jgi:hypothetical protein